MGKTSFKSLEQLSDYISTKINQLNQGQLNSSEIEELTESSQELYERLIVLRHKSYEKYGNANMESVDEPVEVVEEVVETQKVSVEIPEQSVEEILEEISPMMSFDFSEPIEETKVEKVEPIKEIVSEEVVSTPEIEVKEPTLDESEQTNLLNDSISKGTSSLNDSFKSTTSLADRLTNSKIDNLKSAIGINEKFAFITDLFSSSNENYNEAINVLNNCTDGREAKLHLNDLSIQHNWDLDSKTVASFFELIERRY